MTDLQVLKKPIDTTGSALTPCPDEDWELSNTCENLWKLQYIHLTVSVNRYKRTFHRIFLRRSFFFFCVGEMIFCLFRRHLWDEKYYFAVSLPNFFIMIAIRKHYIKNLQRDQEKDEFNVLQSKRSKKACDQFFASLKS